MHNLTYTERARIAYAAGNIELADALEQLAALEAENERLTERVDELQTDCEYIERVTTFNRYHSSPCDLITLKDGRIVAISDEYVGFYDSLDDFEYDCGDDCLAGFWIPKAKGE